MTLSDKTILAITLIVTNVVFYIYKIANSNDISVVPDILILATTNVVANTIVLYNIYFITLFTMTFVVANSAKVITKKLSTTKNSIKIPTLISTITY